MAYFASFPVTTYDINNRKQEYQMVTDILFRTRLLEQVLNNSASYYNYSVKDGETPEIVADKYYGDPYAEWIVMYANNVIDPRYDWLMSYDQMQKYLVEKYGSIATAMTQIHHYEKVVETTDTRTGTVSTRRYTIDYQDPRSAIGDVPEYDTWTDLGSLTTITVPEGTFRNGESVQLTVSRNSVTCYDWEVEQNESKRLIKLIDKNYRQQIEDELAKLALPLGIRRNKYIKDTKVI